MSRATIGLDDRLSAYILNAGLREPESLARLRQETATMPGAAMQIAPEQGQLMAILARLCGVRRYLEIGTFTGYSSLAVGLALPADGQIVACDISADYTAVARRYWAAAGLAARVDLRLGPALESLATLDPAQPFDMAFIDADKEAYDAYYEHCLRLVRPGGLILIDNVLWGGAVADPAQTAPVVATLRRLNSKIHGDDRVDATMLPVGDGLTLIRPRPADDPAGG